MKEQVSRMNTENQLPDASGLNISPPRLSGQAPSPVLNTVFRLLVILSGVFGAGWCFISAFSLPVLPLTVFAYTLLFTAAFAVIDSLKRFQPLLLFAFCFAYCTAVWYLRQSIFQGFLITVNRMMTAYAEHSDYEFPIYLVSAPPAQYSRLCTLFVLIILFLVTGLTSSAVIRRKSFWLAFSATFPLLLSALAFTITPYFPAVLLLFLCWTLMVLSRLSAEKKKDSSKRKQGFSVKSDAVSSRSGLLAVPAVLLSFALILAVFPPQNYRHPQTAEKLRTDMINTATDDSLLNGGKAFAGNVSHVDLSGAGRVEFTGKTALRVKTDRPYPLYLKSFAGSVYTGSSWELLPDSDYTGINQKLSELNVQNMSEKYAILTRRQNNPNFRPFGIQVQNVAAAKQCIYAPYNLTTTPQQISGVRFINDAFIRSGTLFGTGEYSLYAYALSEEASQSSPKEMLLSLAPNSLFRTRDAQAYLIAQNHLSRLNSTNIADYYKITLPDSLLNGLEGEKKTFVSAEQDYRLFLYDKYTQLPQGTKEKILNLMKQDERLKSFFAEDLTSSYSYASVSSISNAVKKYLSDHCYYTLSPKKPPQGMDFADYFLSESHEGYCVHFATAATVMLRAMGVPARYAEGYIVTAGDYLNVGNDGWANIPDSRAHAWVEFYSPGLGWQPFDVTPGFDPAKSLTQDNNPVNQPPAAITETSSAPPESAAQSEPETASSQPAQTESSSSASSAPGVAPQRNPDLSTTTLPLVLIAASITLLIVSTVIKRRVVIKRRSKTFALTDASRAAVAIYVYLAKLEKYGGEISEEISGLALKARFSRQGITEEERTRMVNYAEQTARTCYEQLPRAKRFAFKYVDNLI
ncbi:transglutaminaseTgpA domain-containing protein [Caproiciproducens faecalis]|uniref:Transglutaminase-like domain-containing protein n=1 Tax=Caproiciproducens faecalis TaxID=2820301 RepID=A0ABS7DKR1_9FIRM|nr:transglutaminaseTgpA domain-containing protein [Caproiciproducens faecalis]MBW7571686.1 hypothetical protein [Caproiciproducens faecalis]